MATWPSDTAHAKYLHHHVAKRESKVTHGGGVDFHYAGVLAVIDRHHHTQPELGGIPMGNLALFRHCDRATDAQRRACPLSATVTTNPVKSRGDRYPPLPPEVGVGFTCSKKKHDMDPSSRVMIKGRLSQGLVLSTIINRVVVFF